MNCVINDVRCMLPCHCIVGKRSSGSRITSATINPSITARRRVSRLWWGRRRFSPGCWWQVWSRRWRNGDSGSCLRRSWARSPPRGSWTSSSLSLSINPRGRSWSPWGWGPQATPTVPTTSDVDSFWYSDFSAGKDLHRSFSFSHVLYINFNKFQVDRVTGLTGFPTRADS